MSDDLLKRLDYMDRPTGMALGSSLLGEAAARIRELEAQLATARNAALEEAASIPLCIIPYSPRLKTVLDALTAYQDAILELKEPKP